MEIYIWKDLTFELAKDRQRNQLFGTKSLEAPPVGDFSVAALWASFMYINSLLRNDGLSEEKIWQRLANVATSIWGGLVGGKGAPRCKSVTELMKRQLLLRLLFLLVLLLFPTSSPSSSLQFKHLLCGGKGVRSSIKSLSNIYTKVSCAVIIWTPRTSHPKTQTESRNNKKSQMKWRGKTNNSWFGGKHFKQSSPFLPRSMSS